MVTTVAESASRVNFTNDDLAERGLLVRRVAELLGREIDYIPNAEFENEQPGDGELVLDALPTTAMAGPAMSGMPAHLRNLCEAELLTREQETALFRQMNWLKYWAHRRRQQLDADAPNARLVAHVESLLASAQTIRDHIIKANMRLVISIVKKYVTPQQSFDDMLSDGTFTLMQAVDKFDFDRGFRFSTYAYRSIARAAYRAVAVARKEESRFARNAEEWAFEQEDEGKSSSLTDQMWSDLRDLTAKLLERLDRRERFIIRSRYALGAHRKVKTFQALADKLGVSKERVRQLEQRAVNKLRGMAAECELDELFGAAVA